MHSGIEEVKSRLSWPQIFLIIVTLIVSTLLIYFKPVVVLPGSEAEPGNSYFLGEVSTIIAEEEINEFGDNFFVQNLEVTLLEAGQLGNTYPVEHNIPLNSQTVPKLSVGDKVVLTQFENFDGEIQWIVTDNYRLDSLLAAFVIFFSLIIYFTGSRGFSSLLGLAFSLLVLVFFVIPHIVNGEDPLLISAIAAFFIATISIYLAHGMNKRTTIAVASTVITILLTIVIAYFGVNMLDLFGTGSEEALFLSAYLGQINLQGILLGGIILGTLGVLDDITTAQAAAVEQLKLANKKLSFSELYEKASEVGKEHILSLVNTLVLAYVATSFPVLVLFVINQTQPLWVTINNEFIIEEIVRSLIGSFALVSAVPITTFLAASVYSKRFKFLKYFQ